MPHVVGIVCSILMAVVESDRAPDSEREQSVRKAEKGAGEHRDSPAHCVASKRLPFQRPGATGSERPGASQLEHWARSRTQHHRTVVRSWIVLLASRGLPVAEIASQVQVAAGSVRLWCRRFQEGGVAALTRDARGRGRPAGMSRELTLSVLHAMHRVPAAERRVRQVAACGRCAPTVWRVWMHWSQRTSSEVISHGR
jgi:hypothetical protein